ncbi:AI-2E family transporter [Geoglobus acetivorans]
MERNRLILIFSLIILVFAFIYLLSPILDGILMGVALAYAVRPLHTRLSRRVGEGVSAFLSTMIISLPLLLFFAYGVFQGVTELIVVMKNLETYVAILNSYLNSLDPDISRTVRPALNQFVAVFNTKIGDLAFSVTTKFIFFVMNFLISTIVCFYVIIDGKTVTRKIIDRVFPEKEVGDFFEEFDSVLMNLWFGNFLFALLMGIVSIPYFMAFGIPYVPLLSGLMFLAALIPVFAEWMVILPLTLYLVFMDWVKAAWFLAIGSVFLYIIPELILRPYFVGYTSKIHPLVLMLSFLGGGLAAGVTGFFISPMLAAFLTAVYNHYTKQSGNSAAN